MKLEAPIFMKAFQVLSIDEKGRFELHFNIRAAYLVVVSPLGQTAVPVDGGVVICRRKQTQV